MAAIIIPAAPDLGHDSHTLDVAERQILQGYPEDANFGYHQRILLIPLGGSQWIVGTPTMCVPGRSGCGGNSSAQPQRPLPRRVCADLWAQAALRLGNGDLLKSRAKAHAEILGVTIAADTSGAGSSSWWFADPSFHLFNNAVPGDILANPARVEVKGSSGLVSAADESGFMLWTFMENVEARDRAEWLSEKRVGAGRDLRLCKVLPSPTEATPLLRDALREAGPSEKPANIFKGPSALKEVLPAVTGSGHEVVGYQAQWVTLSGVNGKSGLAGEHLLLLRLLSMTFCVDRLNGHRLAVAEKMARRVLQIERAVKHNARQPDFEGLDYYMDDSLDGTGGARAPEFDSWVGELQRTDAFIAKNARMAREEAEHEKNHNKVDDNKDKKNPKGGGKGEAAN